MILSRSNNGHDSCVPKPAQWEELVGYISSVSVMGGFELDVVTGNISTLEIDKCLFFFVVAPPISSQCQAPVLKDFLTCDC